VADRDACLAAGQGEARLDERFLFGACGKDPFVRRSQGLSGGSGIGQCDLSDSPLAG
jgi:hypothetical protein